MSHPPGKLCSADRMLKLLLLLLQSSAANVFILLMMISCSVEKGNVCAGRVGLEANYHTLPLSSMLPPFVCNTTTSKGPSRKASMKVVHRYGPCSARTQDSPTMTELLRRDESRVKSIQARHKSLSSANNNGEKGVMGESKTANSPTMPSNGGDYVVTVGLGTPAKDLDLIFDTGSHITWTQCQPCAVSCYQQRLPIFDPAASTTYSNETCSSQACSGLKSATGHAPGCDDSTCIYRTHYGDKSFTVGELGRDKLTLTSTDVVDGFLFGCGQYNNLTFGGDVAGLMGLGSDALSIVSQTSQQYGKYFSYCFPTRTGSDGHLTFGKSSTNTNNNLNYTPLLSSQGRFAFYYIEVLGISVNGQQLPISSTVFNSPGTIIDSGTVITRLPLPAYTALRDAFKQQMTMYQEIQSNSIFDTCYDFTNSPNPNIPKISFTFGGNVMVDLDPRGVMLSLDQTRSQVCLAFLGNQDASDVGIFGNLQQQTLEVVYDVAGGKLGFAAGGCS